MILSLHPADRERLAVARARLLGQGFAEVGQPVLIPSDGLGNAFHTAWFPVRTKPGEQARFVTPDDAGYRVLDGTERFLGPIIPDVLLHRQ